MRLTFPRLLGVFAALSLSVAACSTPHQAADVVEAGTDAFDVQPDLSTDTGPTCRTDETLCGAACIATATDRANCGACGHACSSGEVCSMGACAASCGTGLTDCSGSCRNTQTDPAGCGACGTACPTGPNATAFCATGTCGIRCAPGFGDCDGNPANGCEAALDSTSNCGACGVACNFANAGASCTAGRCALAACDANFADCNSNAVDGCEADLRADRTHCGACATACGAGEVCSNSACAASCGTGLTDCTGACRNTQTDPLACGACGNACPSGANSTPFCATGACGIRCDAGFGDCDGNPANGCETALDSTTNCGGCGIACDYAHGTAACTAGVCAMTGCATNFADCNSTAADGCEADLLADSAHCSACTTACGADQVCSNGACGASCGAGLTNCSGACRNIVNDPAACGACGTVCPSGPNATAFCATGACGLRCDPGFGDCDGNPANGCEAALDTLTNCGGCGVACAYANAGASCTAGVCAIGACSANFANCNGSAIDGCESDLRSNGIHCGTCANACGGGQVCSNSACATSCGTGLNNCSGTCRNTQTDPLSCGACGTACVAGSNSTAFCTAGTCGIRCAAGFADCDGNAANGCEVALNSVTNCGACGRTCAFANAGATCGAGGVCAIGTCNAGFANCDSNAANGCEVNTATDRTHCGACTGASATCGNGQVCSASVCQASCGAGLTMCGAGAASTCANLASDPNNCTTCGNVCAGGANADAVCVGARGCQLVCRPGFGNCDGAAANGCEAATVTQGNCGGCGVVCSGAQPFCEGGGCSAGIRGLAWSTSSTANPVNLSATPGTGATDTMQFHYDANGSQVYSTRTFTFSATASTAMTLNYAWQYSGYHAFFATSAQLDAFADGPGGRTTVRLFGPAGVGGGFNVSGTSTLVLTPGYAFGFVAAGRNGDSDARLIGDLTITAN